MEEVPNEVRPTIWKCYIVNCFDEVNKNHGDSFTNHLNIACITQASSEVGDAIPFLDAHIHRKEDGTTKITVYRKKTHTYKYKHKHTLYR